MSRLISLHVIILCMAVLASCASPSYYQAASADRMFGYDDRQIDGPLHRITYTARPADGLDQIYAFAIYHAAELAHSKGATHFEVLEGLINKGALERFIGKATANNLHVFDGRDLATLNTPYPATPFASLPPYSEPVYYMRTQTYIYVPVAPPPTPIQISLLIRLLNAPSLDATRGFDVNDLLTRLGPKIIRPPVKAA